ncbi:MAG: hypothetical protein Ta2B_30430 [Termitinemataceae bacterium]|nr:MAG: hypothetical protein Ta2B_30430 [Termitinemataceae bacterium]
MKNLKLRFFIVFILLGMFIAIACYVPYVHYINSTLKERFKTVTDMVLSLYPKLNDPHYVIAMAHAVYEVGDAEGDQDRAIAGAYGEETQSLVGDYWRITENIRTICDNLGFMFLTICRRVGPDEFQYLLSSGFFKDRDDMLNFHSTNPLDIDLSPLQDLLYPSYSSADLGGNIIVL